MILSSLRTEEASSEGLAQVCLPEFLTQSIIRIITVKIIFFPIPHQNLNVSFVVMSAHTPDF